MDDLATYYEVLEIPESASHQEAYSAYRKLAKEYHPDRLVGVPSHLQKLREDAEEKWRAIQEAWSVLGDPIKRRRYDEALKDLRKDQFRDTASAQSGATSPPPPPPQPSPTAAPPPPPPPPRPNAAPRPTTPVVKTAPSHGWLITIALVFIVFVAWRVVNPGESSSNRTDAAPDNIIDPARCVTEICSDGERWFARHDAQIFADLPQAFGTPLSSLKKVGVVRAGTSVKAQSLVTLEKRREGTITGKLIYGVLAPPGPQLSTGTKIALYSPLEDGCVNSWIGGKVFVLCGGFDAQSDGMWETWLRVRTQGGALGWYRHYTPPDFDKSLVSQTQLNDELADAISNSELNFSAKLAKIENLLGEGADLNGRGNQHGTDPSDAVLMTKDVELLEALMARGMRVHNGESGQCTAQGMHQGIALEPGGDKMLDALLARGMQVRCLSPGDGRRATISAFLTWGIDSGSYSVDRAIHAAEILVKHGADVHQRDADGKTIIDSIDARLSAKPELAALRTALLDLGSNPKQIETPNESSNASVGTQALRVGNGVTAPVLIQKVEPTYSDVARQEYISGGVRLEVEVDTDGKVQNARVVRGLGYGLDEKAIEAVNQWRFRPGIKDGRPVVVFTTVETTFNLPSPRPDPIARYLSDADQKIARRDYDGALAEAESAVRAAPNDTRASALLERVRRIRAILK